MKPLIVVFSLCVIPFPGYSQKVKYKDLFILLYAKQYDEAEPFLRKYLKDNDDNPNAHLYMGLIFQEKSQKSDVLKDTKASKVFADSAILFLERAHKGITEKEIKKNDEYYQGYSRRDLRTGEFGIKLSDVHLDIEKRIQNLKERALRVGMLKDQLQKTEQLYTSCSRVFQGIRDRFPGEADLLLQADEKLEDELKRLAAKYDSCTKAFAGYKTTLQLLGKTGYSQSLIPKEISSLKEDGGGSVDFYADDLNMWDYEKWATAMLSTIDTDVKPLRDRLVALDIEINKLRDRIRKDSVVISREIAEIEAKLAENPVKKYDPAPMPIELFRMKLAELSYGSSHIESRKLRDTSDLVLRMATFQEEFKYIEVVDSLAHHLMERDLDRDALNYQHFVSSAYGTSLVLKSLIKATMEFADHERSRKQVWYDRAKRSLNWLVVDSDSVPLLEQTVSGQKHFPLIVKPEDFTLGLKYGADSVATGYFYTITHSRRPDVKINFTVDKASFAKRNLPVIRGLSNRDEKGQVYFSLIYSQTRIDNMFPATIAKIYRSDGLAWSYNFRFEFPPSELIFLAETGDLSVKIASPTGESKVITIDKNGKQL